MMRSARACLVAAVALLVLRSSLTFVSPSTAGRGRTTKTAAKYTTATILPALAWLKTGFKESDLAPTELRAVNLAGTDVLVGKTEAGKLFCVGNLCPHLGTPMSEGADVIGDVIVCPLHGSSWTTTDGDLIDWCPTPPIIGPLTGFVIEKKNLSVFDVQTSFFGGDIEVLIIYRIPICRLHGHRCIFGQGRQGTCKRGCSCAWQNVLGQCTDGGCGRLCNCCRWSQ